MEKTTELSKYSHPTVSNRFNHVSRHWPIPALFPSSLKEILDKALSHDHAVPSIHSSMCLLPRQMVLDPLLRFGDILGLAVGPHVVSTKQPLAFEDIPFSLQRARSFEPLLPPQSIHAAYPPQGQHGKCWTRSRPSTTSSSEMTH